jgi:acyl-CoA reductase-like NAD-dependent aldehyde dehydrogenase
VNHASVHPAVHRGRLSSRRCRLQVEDTTQAIFFNTGQACTAVRACKLSV